MIQDIYTSMGISHEVYAYGEKTLRELSARFEEIDRTAEYNQLKVLKAMQECHVSEACLLAQPDMAIMTSDVIHLKRCMLTCSMRNPRLSARRSPAVPMRWHWPL